MNDAANDESEGVNSVLLIIVEFNGKGPTYGGKGRSQGCYKLWSDSDTLQAVVWSHMVTAFLSWLIHYVVS